jgi:hypothetical protein
VTSFVAIVVPRCLHFPRASAASAEVVVSARSTAATTAAQMVRVSTVTPP